jgi:hypothetical protein
MATIQSTTVSAPVEYRDLAPFGFPGYRVGDDGSVWSCWVRTRGAVYTLMPGKWRRLTTRLNKHGRRVVRLARDGRSYYRLIHRVVLLAFVGPCPDGMEACHNDGDRTNDSLSNLRWDTRESNILDTIKHGTNRGTNNGHARLAVDQVVEARKRYERGESRASIARWLGVSWTAADHIVRGILWSHVANPSGN